MLRRTFLFFLPRWRAGFLTRSTFDRLAFVSEHSADRRPRPGGARKRAETRRIGEDASRVSKRCLIETVVVLSLCALLVIDRFGPSAASFIRESSRAANPERLFCRRKERPSPCRPKRAPRASFDIPKAKVSPLNLLSEKVLRIAGANCVPVT